MQDTFYITPEHLLRTQTSPVQARTMENMTLQKAIEDVKSRACIPS